MVNVAALAPSEVGRQRPGPSGTTACIKIADDLGRSPSLLTVGETANSPTALAFTATQALLFVADHGETSHLYRLELEQPGIDAPVGMIRECLSCDSRLIR